MTDYKPIRCELHDGFEIACMRRLTDQVIWLDEQGQRHRGKLRFINTATCEGEEFLMATDQNDQPVRIRLDRILSPPPGI